LILDYNYPEKMDGGRDGSPASRGFPDSSSEREKFLQYAIEAISQVGYENIAAIEIWNEWNAFAGWAGWRDKSKDQKWDEPCPTDPSDSYACPRMYAKLVQALLYPERENINLPSIRKVAPGIPVIAGSVLGVFDEKWMVPMLRYLKEWKIMVDGISIHPYFDAGLSWEWKGVATDTANAVRRAKEVVRQTYFNVPIWVTEIGKATNEHPDPRGRKMGVTLYGQAYYLVEMYVRVRALQNIVGIWWYDLRDDAANYSGHGNYDPNHSESHYGLLNGYLSADNIHLTGTTKPAGFAFRALANFWKMCMSISGDAYPNRHYVLFCGVENRHIFLDVTETELRNELSQGYILVDLLGQYPEAKLGTPLQKWVGRHVGFKMPN